MKWKKPDRMGEPDEPALIAEIARLEQRLLARRMESAARVGDAAPPPWRSAFEIFSEPLARRRDGNPVANTEICPGLRLFHDAGGGASAGTFSWMQMLPRATPPRLALTFYEFGGSFFSLVAETPPEAYRMIGPGQRLVVSIEADVTRALACFLRLNLVGGNGQETLHETLVLSGAPLRIAFDPGGIDLGPQGCRGCWLDVILHAPRMCRVEIASLVTSIEPAEGRS